MSTYLPYTTTFFRFQCVIYKNEKCCCGALPSFGFNNTNGLAPNAFSTDRTLKPMKDTSVDPSKSHRTFVIEIFKQGSKYEGDKLNDMRDGRGKFYYQDGGLYDGEWR